MTNRRLMVASLLALIGGVAQAGPIDDAARRWKQSDACVADANKQVPDHTEAALRKRDALVDACLKAHGLPPRAGIAPPAAPSATASTQPG